MGKGKSIKTNAILNIIKQCSNILIPLITYPYITRVLGAASLGRYSFSDSIVQYAIIIATLGVSGYAIREGARIRDDKQKITTLASELLGINICSLLLSSILLALSILFVDRVRQETIIISILSLNMVTAVLGRDWVNSIYEDYLYITMRYIIFQCIALVGMFVFVKGPSDVYLYTCIVVFGNSGAQIANIFHTNKYVPLRIKISKDSLKHICPILFMFSISVASIIYINSDVTILGFLRTDQETGIYYMVGKVYTILKTLINAVITVSVPRISYYLGKNDMDNYNNLLSNLRKYLFAILIPSIVGLFMLSENVLWIIGGAEYIDGKGALQILCFAMLFAVFGCFYAQAILIPNRKEKVFFYATIASAIVNVVINYLLVPYIGILGTACTTALSEIIVVIVCMRGSRENHDKLDNAGLVDVALGTVMIALLCAFVKLLNIGLFLETAISIIGSVIVYFAVLALRKNYIALEVINKIKGFHNR